jgi:hypothetical protein
MNFLSGFYLFDYSVFSRLCSFFLGFRYKSRQVIKEVAIKIPKAIKALRMPKDVDNREKEKVTAAPPMPVPEVIKPVAKAVL